MCNFQNLAENQLSKQNKSKQVGNKCEEVRNLYTFYLVVKPLVSVCQRFYASQVKASGILIIPLFLFLSHTVYKPMLLRYLLSVLLTSEKTR